MNQKTIPIWNVLYGMSCDQDLISTLIYFSVQYKRFSLSSGNIVIKKLHLKLEITTDFTIIQWV